MPQNSPKVSKNDPKVLDTYMKRKMSDRINSRSPGRKGIVWGSEGERAWRELRVVGKKRVTKLVKKQISLERCKKPILIFMNLYMQDLTKSYL